MVKFKCITFYADILLIIHMHSFLRLKPPIVLNLKMKWILAVFSPTLVCYCGVCLEGAAAGRIEGVALLGVSLKLSSVGLWGKRG